MLDLSQLPPRLNRVEASEYLKRQHGLSRSPRTLAKLACLGGGPAFRKAGLKSVLYDVSELDRWANVVIGEPVTSTSAIAAA